MRTLFKRAKTSTLTSLLLGILAVLALTSSAQAWWNDDWTLRRKITIDTSSTGAGISDPIGSVPVLLRLHDGNFQFAAAKEDGSDIRFIAADDKTQLKYHIEKFDGLLDEAFVWVKVPDLKPGAKTTIWLYYGNSGNKATRVEDAKGTFDSDTVLVYHFAEHGAPAADSSGNNNSAKNAGVTIDGSFIGSGLRFDGQSNVTVANSPTLAWHENGALTWSAWIKPTELKPNAVIFSRRDGAKGFAIGCDNGSPYVEVSDSGATKRSNTGTPIAVNAWHQLAVVADKGAITVYLDGDSYGTLSAALPALTTDLTLGGDTAQGATGFTGEMDELQISKIARPAGFVKLETISQGTDKAAKLLTMGEDEQTSSWLSTGYFGIIIKSLTLDGWVVIGILMVMAAISWFVMITKVSYLNGISKGNAMFMKEWTHIARDLTILDHDDEEKVKTLGGRVDRKAMRAMRNASVFRIYHIGAEEIRHRLAGSGSTKVLSAQSIQAIRASLDGGLVRESQKLNSAIVFLTLSIAGGPFLGLLGTVVGVMITFASIAAAGDVNVNAIAPGIAAALVATVAGLAVAIPALFGYNYLLSRIKDATADMQVFIDEFVTKMAEFYRPRAD